MQATQFVSGIFILLIAMIITCDARGDGVCRQHTPCGDQCKECQFGSNHIEVCNMRVCAQGPGARCGNRHNMWGICGDGLMCQCNQCQGCSTIDIDADCYNFACIPDRQNELPGWSYLRNA